jgi:GNAT superfamily N-acetyltransferase
MRMSPRVHTLRTRDLASTDHVRAPWLVYADGTILTVRGSIPQDLPGVALMHSRCSAKTLLDRYRVGGRAPAVLILEHQLREPLSFIVSSDDGRIVAQAQVIADTDHPIGSAQVSILVEDQWQVLGIGRALLRHCAAAAALTGYRQLIAYPGTTAPVIQRLMAGVGTTRLVADVQRHLHTSLPESARYGLGNATGHGVASRRFGTAALG